MAGYLTIDDMRHFLMDRSIDDNEIDLSLLVEDSMIKKAMEYAAKSYASVGPYVDQGLSPDALPFEDDTFLYGVGYHLYLMLIQKGIKNELQYNSGGATVNIDSTRLAHFKEQAQIMKQEFEAKAQRRKHFINLKSAWATW